MKMLVCGCRCWSGLAAGCCWCLTSSLGCRLELGDDRSAEVVSDASRIDCGALQKTAVSALWLSEHKHPELFVTLFMRMKVLIKLGAKIELHGFVTCHGMQIGWVKTLRCTVYQM
jgi:hypothetical protein